MIGKAKDICKKLREYENRHITVVDFLKTNQCTANHSPYTFLYDGHTFTLFTYNNEVHRLTNYYLLFPSKNKNNNNKNK